VDTVEVVEEPGQMDGKGNPEMGVNGHSTVCDGYDLREGAAASKHLRAEGCRRGSEAVPKLVRLGARYAMTNWRTARAKGTSWSDELRAL
jgi:hypothetical protein